MADPGNLGGWALADVLQMPKAILQVPGFHPPMVCMCTASSSRMNDNCPSVLVSRGLVICVIMVSKNLAGYNHTDLYICFAIISGSGMCNASQVHLDRLVLSITFVVVHLDLLGIKTVQHRSGQS